jgi:hypothetical protein
MANNCGNVPAYTPRNVSFSAQRKPFEEKLLVILSMRRWNLHLKMLRSVNSSCMAREIECFQLTRPGYNALARFELQTSVKSAAFPMAVLYPLCI